MNNKKAFDLWVFLCLISPTEFCGLALAETWRFSKSMWSLDRQVTWKSRWGTFTITHNLTKFKCHWRCENWDAPFYEYNLITWYKIHVTWWLWSTQLKSHLANIGDHCPSKSGDKAFLRSRDHMINVTWLSGSDTLKLNHKCYSKSNQNPITKIYMYYKLGQVSVKT